MEPTAVMIHDSNETAPSCAMLDGSMMMPEPIMLTATRVVRPTRPIFLLDSAIAELLALSAAAARVRACAPGRKPGVTV
ncbi:hypothetical protein D3C77_625420 [compost metagenome]